jgi:hypothetical protein
MAPNFHAPTRSRIDSSFVLIMNTIIFVALLTFASASFGADDVRSKVYEGKKQKQLTTRIDPDKSIYGIPFGTTEDKFIAAHGKPMGYLRLSAAETAMLYGKTHAFIFDSGKLAGVRISDNILDWKLSSSQVESGPFDGIGWKLSNGIEKEMSLKDVKKILGDKLSKKEFHEHYYLTDRARVELDFSHYVDRGENDEAYRLFGIFVKAK